LTAATVVAVFFVAAFLTDFLAVVLAADLTLDFLVVDFLVVDFLTDFFVTLFSDLVLVVLFFAGELVLLLAVASFLELSSAALLSFFFSRSFTFGGAFNGLFYVSFFGRSSFY
jgi:hypothetical protein